MEKQYPFVKLPRDITNHAIFRDEKSLKIYIYLLCKATYNDSEILVGKTKVALQPNQVIIGSQRLGEILGYSRQQIRSGLETLSLHRLISIKSTNKFSVVTLLEWGQKPIKDFKESQQIKTQINRLYNTDIDIEKEEKEEKAEVEMPESDNSVISVSPPHNSVKGAEFLLSCKSENLQNIGRILLRQIKEQSNA